VTAFVKHGTTPIIGLFGDQVDKDLTMFTTQIIDVYLSLGWNMTGCGKSCGSDHMSWHKAGYRCAFVTESLFESESFLEVSRLTRCQLINQIPTHTFTLPMMI
jgi:bacterial leucyl aminopeptidase